MLPILKTKRLLLRELEESDWKIICYLRSDPIMNQYVQRSRAETKDEALAFIKNIKKGILEKSIYYWGITEIGHQDIIGCISLWKFSKDRKVVEVGYELSQHKHGKGLMTEALQVVTDFAFDDLNVNCIEAFTHRDNTASRKLLEKNIFQLAEERKDENNENNVIYQRYIRS